MRAGTLRHRITIEQRVEAQDPVSGEISKTWQPFAISLPAEIVPLSAREFMAAQAAQSEITARITIRYLAGVKAKMRAVHSDGTVYNITGVLADPVSGREYLTLPVSEGSNDG